MFALVVSEVFASISSEERDRFDDLVAKLFHVFPGSQQVNNGLADEGTEEGKVRPGLFVSRCSVRHSDWVRLCDLVSRAYRRCRCLRPQTNDGSMRRGGLTSDRPQMLRAIPNLACWFLEHCCETGSAE